MTLDSTLAVHLTDDAVEFAFTVENTGDAHVDLEFRSGNRADVAVSEDGVEVWRWSEGRLFTQALETVRLGPGETMTVEATWADPPDGEYTAEATLEATNATLVERTAFTVP